MDYDMNKKERLCEVSWLLQKARLLLTNDMYEKACDLSPVIDAVDQHIYETEATPQERIETLEEQMRELINKLGDSNE